MTVTPSHDAGLDAGQRVEDLCRIADQTAAALATGTRVAGPAAPQEGISQLVVSPQIRGVYAELADGSVAMVLATPEVLSPEAQAGDLTALVAELGDALIAGAAAAGGTTSDVRAVMTLDELPRRLSEHLAGDELVGAGIFDGDTLIGSVGVCGSIEPRPVAGQPADIGTGATAAARPTGAPRNFSLLADVELGVSAELGRTSMSMGELLDLQPGAVIDLDRPVGTPIDVLVNGTLIARGEVVVVDDSYAVRVTEVVAEGDER